MDDFPQIPDYRRVGFLEGEGGNKLCEDDLCDDGVHFRAWRRRQRQGENSLISSWENLNPLEA